jgi:hypothetical protein
MDAVWDYLRRAWGDVVELHATLHAGVFAMTREDAETAHETVMGEALTVIEVAACVFLAQHDHPASQDELRLLLKPE